MVNTSRRLFHYMGSTYSAQQSTKDLGLCRRVGYQISACSSVYPFPSHYVKQIRNEFDPSFVPLWIQTTWKTPNDGLVQTGCHMLARFVRHPRAGANVVEHLLLPTSRTYGIKYEVPILQALMLDGLTEEERDRGELPRYEPITRERVEGMRRAMWMRNNKGTKRWKAEIDRIQALEILRNQEATDKELAYRRHHDALRLRCVNGTAARVFVSDTLKTLREAAGYTGAAA